MRTIFIIALVLSSLASTVETSTAANGLDPQESPSRRNLQGIVALTGLDLIDSNTGKRITTLTSNQVIEVNQIPGMTPSFNINATFVGTAVKSVAFGYGTTIKYRTDNTAPFSFCGNKGQVFFTCSLLGMGTHVVTATPYSAQNGVGMAGTPVKVTFTIVASQPMAPAKTPAIAPTPAPKSPTNAPRTPTPAPKVPTPSPKAFTKAPVAPTPAPRTPTKAPQAPTKAPKVPTKTPTKAPSAPMPVAAPPTAVVSNYNIQLDMTKITTTADQNIFASAAAKWQSVITGDLSSYDTRNLPPRDDGCRWPSIIDDLFICAEYQAIDGPYNVLGYAGPEYIRNANGLPFSGSMVFDLDDLTRLRGNGGGKFLSTIIHEMGHVLGTSFSLVSL
jgi:hypothetical protein